MVSEVRDADSEKPLIVLKVSSDDGGFFVRQKFPKKSIPEVSEGDLVIWRAIASGDRTLLDRSTWAGSIEYKVAPVYDIHLGWKRL